MTSPNALRQFTAKRKMSFWHNIVQRACTKGHTRAEKEKNNEIWKEKTKETE